MPKLQEEIETNYISGESLPWVPFTPYSDEVFMKYWKIDPVRGEVLVSMRFPPGLELPTHYHTGIVIGHTVRGAWRYKEHDWVSGPGDTVYEMKVIHSPYTRAWIIQRTLVKSHEDLPNAVAIQAETKLVPLNRWKKDGLDYQPPVPEKEVTAPTEYKVPGTQAGEEPLTYWNALGAALKQFKPPAADQPELALLKSVGIGPGKFPVNNAKLSAGTIAGLRAAVAAGPGQVTKELTEMFHAGFTAHNGCSSRRSAHTAPTTRYGR
jgi:hypothetical protein